MSLVASRVLSISSFSESQLPSNSDTRESFSSFGSLTLYPAIAVDDRMREMLLGRWCDEQRDIVEGRGGSHEERSLIWRPRVSRYPPHSQAIRPEQCSAPPPLAYAAAT